MMRWVWFVVARIQGIQFLDALFWLALLLCLRLWGCA